MTEATAPSTGKALLDAYAERYFADAPQFDELGGEDLEKLVTAARLLEADTTRIKEDGPDLDGRTMLRAYRRESDPTAPEWDELTQETRDALLDAQGMIHKVAREFEEESERMSKMLTDRRAKLHKRRG